MAKDKGASHRLIAKRPPGTPHVLGKPTKQPKLVPSYSSKGNAFIAGKKGMAGGNGDG